MFVKFGNFYKSQIAFQLEGYIHSLGLSGCAFLSII
jgi:Fe2+ transport system protein B